MGTIDCKELVPRRDGVEEQSFGNSLVHMVFWLKFMLYRVNVGFGLRVWHCCGLYSGMVLAKNVVGRIGGVILREMFH